MPTASASGTWMLLTALATFAPACERCGLNRDSSAAQRPRRAPVAGLGPSELKLNPPAPNQHRIVLDDRALGRVRDSAKRDTPAWRAVRARCEEASRSPIDSGYQGFEWADAVASLSLCYHATGEAPYAKTAGNYLSALLDDRLKIGDAKGGATVVTHDSGYGIRTFGAYAALGYDWLRGTPGMTPARRDRTLERLGQWLSWYADKGYLKDRPTANYYWGYLTALSFAGLAFSGESPNGDSWLKQARKELAENVLPTFRDDLKGGGWPEGWQYGEYTTAEIALVAEAFRTGASIDIAGKMPWLGDNVTHHVYALLPDGKSVYDGGTWGEHPAKPSALALSALSIVLEGVDDKHAAEARYLIAHDVPPLTREQAFIGLLADRPGAAERDPRKGAATSLSMKGQGLTFVRSDWSKSATWASFQAGAWLAEDHQDKDQGHFELWRGSDALLVDAGDSEGSATINHNTLLVDDGGKLLEYAPNQGVWGRDAVKTTRFGDDGVVAVAVGDIGEAYAPKCARDGCKDRAVERLIRTFVFVRPSLLVIDDRVRLDRGSSRVSWAAHVTTNPKVSGNLVSAVIGSSRFDLRVLEPDTPEIVALKEPTASGEGPHRMNHCWGPMWRIEAKSPTGERDRGFLTFINADRADAEVTAARRVSGDGLYGAFGQSDKRGVAVLFANAAGSGNIALDGAESVVIAGLEPGAHYRVTSEPETGCIRRVRLSKDDAGTAATSGGFIRVSRQRGCS